MSSFRLTFIKLMWFYIIFHMDPSECCVNNASQHSKPIISHLESVSNKQSLTVSWLVNHSGTDMFEIQISRTEKHSIVHTTNVSVSSRESREYTWTWTSELPLECVDHSVRIRNICNVSAQSPWSDWKTRYREIPGGTKIYPFQQVLREGSNRVFCCIPPPGENITSMAFKNEPYHLVSVGDKVKTIAVNNLTIPKQQFKGLTFSCRVTNTKDYHVFNYVGFPPQKPQNINCTTADFTKVTCTWESGRKEATHRDKPAYTLHIQNTDGAPIHCDRSHCIFPAVPQLQVYNISVVAKNMLGEEMESYSFNISERVLPLVEWDKVSQGVTDANVSWSIQGNLTQNKFICEIYTLQQGSITESCDSVRGFCKARLKHLLPNTRYIVQVRCSVSGSLWGIWTKPRYFTTGPLVSLDVWRRIQQLSDSYSRQVTLFWKQHNIGTVKIQRFRVQWSQEGEIWKDLNVDSEQNQTKISIGLGKCEISVEAVLLAGSSIPAHIIIPPKDPADDFPLQKWLSGSTSGALYLSWNDKTTVTCGYTVEWCILGNTVPCTLCWMKVPKENNTLYLPAEHFKAGCRYTFNVYGCTENGDKLLETQTGYSQELIPVQIPCWVEPVQRTYSSVTLEWHYNEDDPDEPAFITGYLITVQDAGSDVLTGQAANRFNVSVADPRKKSVTIEGLQQDKEYSFSVSALTKDGRGVPAHITIKTKINYYSYVIKTLTPIFIVLGCVILLWSRRKMLKGLLVYPSGMNIKTPELDSFLQETEQRLRSQAVEDCISCDIEIVTKSSPEIITELCSDGSSSPLSSLSPPLVLVQEGYSPQSASLFWNTPAFNQILSVTNKSYLTLKENCSEPQITFKEIKSDSGPSDCLPESSHVLYGYISYDTL